MTNYNKTVRIFSILLLIIVTCLNGLIAQENESTLSGIVLESGSGIPVKQAVISVASNGEYTNTNDEGKFTINLPSTIELITVSFPGYHTTELYTTGKYEITIFLTKNKYKSSQQLYPTPLGPEKYSDATNAVSVISKQAFDNSSYTTIDQNLSGKVAGLNITEHSGMPGHNSWINLRGISSVYGRNQPLVFLDGMIHEINYSNNEIIEGHLLNPFDLINVDDMINVSVQKVGEGYLGSAGSNGLLTINTEENENTSAAILVKMYGGVSLPYKGKDVLNASQFKTYFTDLLEGQELNSSQIDNHYPWLNGNSSINEYYRYNNNTDWQSEITKPSALQKYYIYLRGGDDIATYNISTGYSRQGSVFDQWRMSKYNLRLNGKVNITKKLSIVPNTKLSLSDGFLSNMGPTSERNAVVSAILKSPLMHPHERSSIDGSVLYPFDDVGAFNQSNPSAIIENSLGAIRNFQLISSVKVGYNINSNLSVSNLIGISMNNDRQNMFIPDIGVTQLDSAKNNPMDMVTEFRSFQNHTTVTYKNTFDKNHHLTVNGGVRVMHNGYKNNYSIDLNTPSDDFRSLGAGSLYWYLRENGGEAYTLSWMSFFADGSYRFNDKYYLRASLSLDGSSAFNENNRYNFYPSLFGAWRISKEDITLPSWINDLKLRAAASLTGNMFNDTYLRSKTTYTGRRYGTIGVPIKDYITNEDLSAEKKFSTNTGIDLTFGQSAYNVHVDYHMSFVNNLIINQSLPYNYGYTDFYDNGGKLAINGIELGADGRWNFGEYTLILDGNITFQKSKITDLEFINPDTEFVLNQVEGAEYAGMIDNPVNAFYGYKTNGILNNDTDIIGPKGEKMSAGDVYFVDVDGNNIIDEKDKQIIGDPNPDLFGAFTASLSYKKFTFSTQFSYTVGNDMFNYVGYKAIAMDNYANQSVDVLDRWQPGSSGATLPKAQIGDPKGNNMFSDRFIEDASFLRLKQLMVSYNTDNIFGWQKNATFYVTGSNLLTLTKYTGYDPETMYQNDPFYMGIDYGKLPLARSVIFGIQLNL